MEKTKHSVYIVVIISFILSPRDQGVLVATCEVGTDTFWSRGDGSFQYIYISQSLLLILYFCDSYITKVIFIKNCVLYEIIFTCIHICILSPEYLYIYCHFMDR